MEMQIRTGQSRYQQVDKCSLTEHLDRDHGFSLIEIMICTLILTIGMLAIAALLAVTTQMHLGARENTRSTRLAQDKFDELMKLDFDTAPAVAIGGSLTESVDDYFDTPFGGVTRRWSVAAGPATDTRVVHIRVENLRSQYGRHVDLTTIIREW